MEGGESALDSGKGPRTRRAVTAAVCDDLCKEIDSGNRPSPRNRGARWCSPWVVIPGGHRLHLQRPATHLHDHLRASQAGGRHARLLPGGGGVERGLRGPARRQARPDRLDRRARTRYGDGLVWVDATPHAGQPDAARERRRICGLWPLQTLALVIVEPIRRASSASSRTRTWSWITVRPGRRLRLDDRSWRHRTRAGRSTVDPNDALPVHIDLQPTSCLLPPGGRSISFVQVAKGTTFVRTSSQRHGGEELSERIPTYGAGRASSISTRTTSSDAWPPPFVLRRLRGISARGRTSRLLGRRVQGRARLLRRPGRLRLADLLRRPREHGRRDHRTSSTSAAPWTGPGARSDGLSGALVTTDTATDLATGVTEIDADRRPARLQRRRSRSAALYRHAWRSMATWSRASDERGRDRQRRLRLGRHRSARLTPVDPAGGGGARDLTLGARRRRTTSALPADRLRRGASASTGSPWAADAELVIRGPATVVIGDLTLAEGASLTLDTSGGDVELFVTHVPCGSRRGRRSS